MDMKKANSDMPQEAQIERRRTLEKEIEVEMFENADAATATEHELTVKGAFQAYPMAVVWSMLFCVCIIMDGYDSSLVSNFYGLPSFQLQYGKNYGDGDYRILPAWQTALAMGSPIGRVIGGLIQGSIAEPIGRKKTLIGCLFLLTGFIFIQFFSTSLAVLLVGQLLCGTVWGVLSSLAPTYASEVCPLRLRDLLTAYVNLCWSTGQFIAIGVVTGMQSNASSWSYRIPFAVQWVWPVLILSFIYWIPESPYWLVRHGKIAEAEAALNKLIRKSAKVDVKHMLNLIERTNLREQEYQIGTSYAACFKGVNLRRTEISAMAWAIQILCGLSLPFWAVVFFELAGLDPAEAFNLTLGMTGLGFVGTCCSFFIIPYFGRRTIYFGGLGFLTFIMLLFGFLGIAPNNPSIVYAEAALLLVWFFGYFFTVGPLAYVIFSETSAVNLRGHTVAIALVAYSTLGVAYNVASPYLLDTSEANLGAKTGLIYGSISLLTCFWCYFRLPECKGRTYEELDIMFERKVPAREFKNYVI